MNPLFRGDQNYKSNFIQFLLFALAYYPGARDLAAQIFNNHMKESLINFSSASRIGLDGYDPVAFHTQQQAVHGDPGTSAAHAGTTYLFANQENKGPFETNPEKYLPEFGGFCAFGVSVGALFPVDISTWQLRSGKLYLILNPELRKEFDKDFDGNLRKAQQNWPGLVERNQTP